MSYIISPVFCTRTRRWPIIPAFFLGFLPLTAYSARAMRLSASLTAFPSTLSDRFISLPETNGPQSVRNIREISNIKFMMDRCLPRGSAIFREQNRGNVIAVKGGDESEEITKIRKITSMPRALRFINVTKKDHRSVLLLDSSRVSGRNRLTFHEVIAKLKRLLDGKQSVAGFVFGGSFCFCINLVRNFLCTVPSRYYANNDWCR